MTEHTSDTPQESQFETSQQAFDEAGLNRLLDDELGSIDAANDPDYDPLRESMAAEDAEREQAAAEQEKEQSAEMTAFMVIGSFEGLIKTMGHPRFALDDATKQTAVERYKPILVKYGPAAMGVFGRYQDEIMAGMFTATLAMQSIKQLKQLKAEDAALAQAKRQAVQKPTTAANDEGEQQQVA